MLVSGSVDFKVDPNTLGTMKQSPSRLEVPFTDSVPKVGTFMGLDSRDFLVWRLFFLAAYYTLHFNTLVVGKDMCFSFVFFDCKNVHVFFLNSLINIYLGFDIFVFCFFWSRRFFVFFFLRNKKNRWRCLNKEPASTKICPQSCASRDVSRLLPQGVLQWQGHCLTNRVAPWPSELPIVVAFQIPSHFPLAPMDYTPEI